MSLPFPKPWFYLPTSEPQVTPVPGGALTPQPPACVPPVRGGARVDCVSVGPLPSLGLVIDGKRAQVELPPGGRARARAQALGRP